MLSPDLLRHRNVSSQHAEPAWLSPRDDVWLRQVLRELDARVGQRVGELESDVRRRLEEVALQHDVDARVLRGVIHVAARRFERKTRAGLDPVPLRSRVFAAAAQTRRAVPLTSGWKDQLLAGVGAAVGLAPEALLHQLYADLPKERLLGAPGVAWTELSLRESYHLALLQGYLLRASDVTVWVREHARSVARFAKLSGLLCTFEPAETGTKIQLSGPLALFHPTLKYGRALARFIPSALSTPGYRIAATCSLPEGPVSLVVDARAPLPREHSLPLDADSALEARLARDLRRAHSEFTLERESAVFQAGPRTFYPDFALRRGEQRVFVELVGFWTPEYLHSKLAALSQLTDVPLVVVVDASHGVLPQSVPHAEVVSYQRAIDPSGVIAAAERALARHLPPFQTAGT